MADYSHSQLNSYDNRMLGDTDADPADSSWGPLSTTNIS